MKKKLRKICLLLLAFLMIFMCLMAGCKENEPPQVLPVTPEIPEPELPYGIFTDDDFLKADGTLIKTKHGMGDEVILRGTNAGGYLVVEWWMTAVNSTDHKTMTETMSQKFGAEKTLELWEYYRSQYWADEDFQNCADMGMNVIRLPFSYMNVDPAFNNVPAVTGQQYNFILLDNFIKRAAKFGIYTMLDLHGAYGSQNGKDHSGQVISNVGDIDFYSNEDKMQKTIDLWSALANYYKDNPAVCGYDILNEPGENAGTTTTRHWNFFDRVYEAIRLKDTEHIVIFESCWAGSNLPAPSVYGWENCMYSFHHYTNSGNNYSIHMKSMLERVNEVTSMKFGVPIHMGEFTCYNDEQSWEGSLALLNTSGWHWTTWTYKLNRTNDTSYPGWGIYYTRAERADPAVDNYDTMKAKWANVKTTAQTTKMTFESDKTLYDIMKKYCAARKSVE